MRSDGEIRNTSRWRSPDEPVRHVCGLSACKTTWNSSAGTADTGPVATVSPAIHTHIYIYWSENRCIEIRGLSRNRPVYNGTPYIILYDINNRTFDNRSRVIFTWFETRPRGVHLRVNSGFSNVATRRRARARLAAVYLYVYIIIRSRFDIRFIVLLGPWVHFLYLFIYFFFLCDRITDTRIKYEYIILL